VSEQEPIFALLKDYLSKCRKKVITVQVLTENLKKAYENNKFNIQKLFEEPSGKYFLNKKNINNEKTKEIQEILTEHKTIRQLIEEQKIRLKIQENENLQRRNPNSAKTHIKPQKSLNSARSTKPRNSPRKITKFEEKNNVPIRPKTSMNTYDKTPVRNKANCKQINKFINKPELSPKVCKRSKSTISSHNNKLQRFITNTKIESKINIPPLRIPIKNIDPCSVKIPKLKLEILQSGNPLENIEEIKKSYDDNNLLIKEDFSEIDNQNGMNNSEILSILEVCDKINCEKMISHSANASPRKKIRPKPVQNLFNVENPKKLGHILKHGYSYQFHAKTQYQKLKITNIKTTRVLKHKFTNSNIRKNSSSLSLSFTDSKLHENEDKLCLQKEEMPKNTNGKSCMNITNELNLGGIKALYSQEELQELTKLHSLYATHKRIQTSKC